MGKVVVDLKDLSRFFAVLKKEPMAKQRECKL
jgi:hypothetical protein